MLGSLRALALHSRQAAALELSLPACSARCFAKAREIGDNKTGEELADSKHLQTRETLHDSSATQSDILPQTRSGDYRSHSGLGLGDNIHNHTDKWFQVRPTP